VGPGPSAVGPGPSAVGPGPTIHSHGCDGCVQEGGEQFWELWGLYNIRDWSLSGIYFPAMLRQVGKVRRVGE
jgi:hypothetical protein